MSRFHYSEKAWLPLWFLFGLMWLLLMQIDRQPNGIDFLSALFMVFGGLALFLLAFLFILDLIEWRWPGK